MKKCHEGLEFKVVEFDAEGIISLSNRSTYYPEGGAEWDGGNGNG